MSEQPQIDPEAIERLADALARLLAAWWRKRADAERIEAA